MDNQVIDILKTVLKQYGLSVLTDAKRCRALLTDYCCGAYTREVKLLLIALEEGVATDLQHPLAGLPASLQHSRLVDRLVTERFLDRTVADWVVCAWRDALMDFFMPTVRSVEPKVEQKQLNVKGASHTLEQSKNSPAMISISKPDIEQKKINVNVATDTPEQSKNCPVFNWGAFGLGPIWLVCMDKDSDNLLCFIWGLIILSLITFIHVILFGLSGFFIGPIIIFAYQYYLGINGNNIARSSRVWSSDIEFCRVQRIWAIFGLITYALYIIFIIYLLNIIM